MLLHFLRWLAADGRLPFAILLKEGGPLVAEFQATGPTFLFDCPWPDASRGRVTAWEQRVRYVLHRMRFTRWAKSLGVGMVYSNTAANGELCGVLERLGVKVVTHVHELDNSIVAATKDWAFQRLKAMSVAYIAASRAVADYLTAEQCISADSVVVHHEFIDTTPLRAAIDPAERSKVRESLGVSPDETLVLGVGTVHWRKGSDLLVRLAEVVKARGAKIQFAWVGASREGAAQIRHDATRLGVGDRVRCVAAVSDPIRYYQAADVFALLSREDPFPLVMLEAGAAGLPVVCFEGAGGGPEFVEHDSGVVVPYLDVLAMAEALMRLASDPAERSKLGSRAAEKARLRHDLRVAAPLLADDIVRLMSAT